MDRNRRALARAIALARWGAMRPALSGATAAGLWMRSGSAAAALDLKISHQFPGGSGDGGDFRDRVCRRFASEIQKRSGGALTGTVYAASSLMKTKAQFSALRKGALDLTLVPLSYAGGEVPETNIGLMPGVVTSYEQGAAWKNAEVGRSLASTLADKGVIVVSWIWQAGGVASRGRAIVEPEDAAGLKVRGGSREMDMVLRQAGASVLDMPSNEIYAAMQTGALDAAMTSSTSLISFRLEEIAHQLTTGRGRTYWFMLEPLLMSRTIFESLPAAQQQLIMTVGAELEVLARDAAQADDRAVADVYVKTGGSAHDLDERTVKRWQDIARATAWKDFAARSAGCARLLQLVEKAL
jgi:TRAP-type C4-dicarboxylate transport system substrate-binding protein